MNQTKHEVSRKLQCNQARKSQIKQKATESDRRPPSQHELTAIKKVLATKREPRLKVQVDGAVTHIIPDHPDKTIGEILLWDALGTSNQDLANGLLIQLAGMCEQDGQIIEDKLNFMFAIIKENKPRDSNEALLLVQMAAIQELFMKTARRLANADDVLEHDTFERALNKLGRTFATQLETLKRYRSGATQSVTVSVTDGAQPVNNVTTTASEIKPVDTDKSNAAPLVIDSKAVPMPTLAEAEVPIQVPTSRRRNGSSHNGLRPHA